MHFLFGFVKINAVIVIRFYAKEPYLEPLAKYTCEKDPGDNKMRELLRPIVKDPITDNSLTVLNDTLVRGGFERVEFVSSIDYDRMVDAAYDAVISAEDQSITLIAYDVKQVDVPKYGEDAEKKIRGKYAIGQILQS